MYYNYNQYVNLGAFLDKNACTFAIYAKNVSSLILNIFHSSEDVIPYMQYKLSPVEHKLGDIWSISLENIQEGTLYTWEINGFSVLDPYALAYTGNEDVKNKKSIVIKRVGTETKHALIPKKVDWIISPNIF